VLLEGLGQVKNPMTSSGTEPVTFQLVAQCLNNYTAVCPHCLGIRDFKSPGSTGLVATFKLKGKGTSAKTRNGVS
jgi:hypothetical protein